MTKEMTHEENLQEAEPEIINQDLVPTEQESHLGLETMDNIISMGRKIDEYHKTMQKMKEIVIRQAYAGDWVCHSRRDETTKTRKANLSGAGVERIACFLGFKESNWKDNGKRWDDEHKHYSYSYEADFSLGGRTVHAMGEASTRNKFFSFERGQWKELSDVREDHIKKAAFRECRKEGIRTWMGLRNVPITMLQKTGMDLDLIHYVNFRDSNEAVKTEVKTYSQTNIVPMTIGIKSVEHSISRKGSPYAKVTDMGNYVYVVWGKKDSQLVKDISDAEGMDVKLKVEVEVKEEGEKMIRTIRRLIEVVK